MTKDFLSLPSRSSKPPDKIADQISDGVVDALIAKDLTPASPSRRWSRPASPSSRQSPPPPGSTFPRWCAAHLPHRYTHSDMGYDGNTCGVMVSSKASQDIALSRVD